MPNALLYAGGSDILRAQAGRSLALPAEIILLGSVAELRQVALSERFVEIGAAVSLAEILELRENAVPELLLKTLRLVATPSVRSLATIGGNLAAQDRFMDAWPALACLDALAECRRGTESRWVNVNRFVDAEGRPSLPPGSLVTRIRLPLDVWDLSAARKIGTKDYPGRSTAVFAFLARADKGILADFRLAFAGERAIRDRDIETRILGRRLPLPARERETRAAEYRERAAGLPPAMAAAFAALVDGAFDLLSR
jgi:CO/xanthine dehydrogenase FAD-binding subunit